MIKVKVWPDAERRMGLLDEGAALMAQAGWWRQAGGVGGQVALEAVSRHGPGSLHARPY